MKTKTIKKTNLNNPIRIIGAKKHNLKNISVEIPRNKLVIITGLSGSGKSSLAFGTLFAEGQKKYAESLNTYVRQFISNQESSEVERIDGLCPAIAIEQKTVSSSTRSTVGTLSELNDFLKLLFIKIGEIISPITGKQVVKYNAERVWQVIQNFPSGISIHILTALNLGKENYKDIVDDLILKGFHQIYKIDLSTNIRQQVLIEEFEFNINYKYYVLIERLITKSNYSETEIHSYTESLHSAFLLGNDEIWLDYNKQEIKSYPNHLNQDGISFEEPNPHLFSFNNAYGVCQYCQGRGKEYNYNIDLLIPNKNLSLAEGAIHPWNIKKLLSWQEKLMARALFKNFPIHKKINKLTKEEMDFIMNGDGTVAGLNQFIEWLEFNSNFDLFYLKSKYKGWVNCSSCLGSRLKREALYIKVFDTNFAEIQNKTIVELNQWLKELVLTPNQEKISKIILAELQKRTATLLKVGLGYLSLNRSGETLSGGESQRIYLSKNLNCNLCNSMYILDEPTIGLHPKDTNDLIKVLHELRDLNNTVILVEHDENIIKKADFIIDMGLKAAQLGGEVVYAGNYNGLLKCPTSLTAQSLRKELEVKTKKTRVLNHFFKITNIKVNNLNNITIQFPLKAFCVVCGVSGSGKSTLVKSVLYPLLMIRMPVYKEYIEDHIKSKFLDIVTEIPDNNIKEIVIIDQHSIGKTSRSTPVTYIKAFDDIRNLYANTVEAKKNGLAPSFFSFNTAGGRCEKCAGEGIEIVEMQFMPDITLVCEDCQGKRYKSDILEIVYKNKNINDVLNLTVDEALKFFELDINIYLKILPLKEVGLGYLKLGQSNPTLSGGERQRLKLASYLEKGLISVSHSSILFIFDEPTTGLHSYDIQILLSCFDKLIKNGHTILCVEHNLDLIKYADWLIELGPGGGDSGGNLIFSGPISSINDLNSKSIIAKYL